MAFIVLVSNGDAHVKNWSLIYRDPRIPTLSPAYDLVSTATCRPGDVPENLGLKFGRSRQFERVVHHGGDCARVTHPRLRMGGRGGNVGVNVAIECVNCGKPRNMREAMGRRGRVNLPSCRGRHPHLATFDPGCKADPKVLVVGASNQWFAQNLSVLHVPRAGTGALADKVEKHWAALEGIPDLSALPYLRTAVPAFKEMEGWSDDEIRQAIEAHHAKLAAGEDADDGYPDLRTPEWEAFSAARLPEGADDFTLRRLPDGVPGALAGIYGDVVQAERLREVRATVGFTRLDAPDPEDPDLVVRAPLARSDPSWAPASEVRGEGVFLRVPEDTLRQWERRVEGSEALAAHRDAYARFRQNRYSDRLPGSFDPMRGWPGAGWARRADSVPVQSVWSGPSTHAVPVRATARALVE